MAFKLVEAAHDRWRAVNAPHLVAIVRAGGAFINGHLVERPTEPVAGSTGMPLVVVKTRGLRKTQTAIDRLDSRSHGGVGVDDVCKHHCWRLRGRPGSERTMAEAKTTIGRILDDLVTTGAVQRWWESLYEPESLAFGGHRGMEIAHDLFHADSHSILTYLRHRHLATSPERTVGRRELSILLRSTLFRSARQDGHEQGDVRHRVTQMRPLPPDTPTERPQGMLPRLRRLITVDTSPASALFDADQPLAFAAPWFAAFATAGRHLADAASAKD